MQRTTMPRILKAALLAAALCSMAAAAETRPEGAPAIFDGTPKTFVIATNSHRGGHFLERKLKRYCEEKFGKAELITRLRPDKEPDRKPDVYFQHMGFGLWEGVRRPQLIQGADDKEGIDRGVARIQSVIDGLRKNNPQAVIFVSSLHYHYHWYATDPLFPNNILAYREYNRRTKGHLAIDCFTPTKAAFPVALSGDMYHPSKCGMEVYTHYWFKAMLEHDGREVPAWSAQEMNEAIEQARKDFAAIGDLKPAGGEVFQSGDKMVITWAVDPKLVPEMRIGLSLKDFSPHYFEKIDTATANGRFEWVVPAEMKMGDWRLVPVVGEGCRVYLSSTKGQQFTYSKQPFAIQGTAKGDPAGKPEGQR